MNLLSGFTDSPSQTTNIILDDGSFATIDLYFRPQQNGWFYDLVYKTFSLLVQRIVYSENMLRQFRKQIPFGLAVLSTDNNDPMIQTAFSSNASVFILLNSDDVAAIEIAKFTRDD